MSRYLRKKNLTKRNKVNTKDIEDELIEWILINKSLGIPVTSWEVIIKACR